VEKPNEIFEKQGGQRRRAMVDGEEETDG
jgi:hypothetical protein